MINPIPNRFMKKIDFSGDCWLWTAGITWKGYGRYTVKGKSVRAHRASWIFFKGEIPNHISVLHKCDVRNCVNPNHLFLGTDQDNMQDMVNKGRHGAITKPELVRRGEDNCSAKLTWEQVREIRLQSGISQLALASMYGVTKTTIGKIIRNERWIENRKTNAE